MTKGVFVPRILLCGDIREFFSRVAQRPYELVGQIRFENEKFFIGDKAFGYPELPKILHMGGGGDYIVFVDADELSRVDEALCRTGCPRSQVVTLREFNHLPTDGFRDMSSDIQLLMALKNFSVGTLLDVEAHFAKSYLMTKTFNDALEIDCVCREELLPIKENIYTHVYRNLGECALKHYDAALLDAQTPTSFDDSISCLQNTADLMIIFSRYGSALENHIRATVANFKGVTALPSYAGHWFFCRVKKPADDFAMYVVTHKALPPEHVNLLPEGYKVIHAGRALGSDLGFQGDDTGDNISELNPYINELTALYWIWKNTSHEVIGLSHYRRFFSTNGKTFLTRDQTFDALKNCDIITDRLAIRHILSSEILRGGTLGKEFPAFAESVIRKNLMRTQPDYSDAFNYKMNSPTCFYKNMFVTRRPVFNAYCEWLFSFMIDATREMLSRTPLASFQGGKKRLMGHFAERMLTVWLLKNRLRIKEISIVQVNGL